MMMAQGGPINYLDPEEAHLIEAREGYGLSHAWEAWKNARSNDNGHRGRNPASRTRSDDAISSPNGASRRQHHGERCFNRSLS